MKIKRFKLNDLSAEGLRQKEMNAIIGGRACTCSCYWYGQGGAPSGTNTYANYGIGDQGGYSSQGCNQFKFDDKIGNGLSGYTSAN